MTIKEWAVANPDKAAVIVVTILAAIVGSLGNLLADHVDGDKHPRLYQLGRVLQNAGIALPKLADRIILLFQGAKPSEPVKPTSADGKLLVIGFAVLVGGLAIATTAACGTGAAACKVVDVASNTCAVVRYLAPDGTVEELDAHDLEQAAAAKKAARQRAQVKP